MAVDEEKVVLYTAIAALQIMLVKLFAQQYALAGFSQEDIALLHSKIREKLPEWIPIKVPDPAISDVMNSEITNAIDQILKQIERETKSLPL
jgi:hypothetical protein